MGSKKVWERGVVLTSTLHWFETDLLALEENFAGLARLNRELVTRVEGVGSPHRAGLDMDSSESPVYGEQEQSAYNGYFESVCYHPLFLFDRQGECLAAKPHDLEMYDLRLGAGKSCCYRRLSASNRMERRWRFGRRGLCQARDLPGTGRARSEVCHPAPRE